MVGLSSHSECMVDTGRVLSDWGVTGDGGFSAKSQLAAITGGSDGLEDPAAPITELW